MTTEEIIREILKQQAEDMMLNSLAGATTARNSAAEAHEMAHMMGKMAAKKNMEPNKPEWANPRGAIEVEAEIIKQPRLTNVSDSDIINPQTQR